MRYHKHYAGVAFEWDVVFFFAVWRIFVIKVPGNTHNCSNAKQHNANCLCGGFAVTRADNVGPVGLVAMSEDDLCHLLLVVEQMIHVVLVLVLVNLFS